jgi:hypothetical protein
MAHLTNAQLLTLKAAILGETDPTFVALRNASDEFSMAAWFNENTSPAFIVWKTSVPLNQVVAEVDGVELVGLTSIKLAAYQCLLLAGSVNPSKVRTRDGFDNVFSAAGGQITRPLLLALWKRTARRYEKLYATGTGSDGSPATLVIEGTIDSSHIQEALEAV